MSGEVLTLLCGRCRSTHRLEVAALATVPFWLSMLLEAFGTAGVPAILTETCATCMEMPARSANDLLVELKRMLDGR